MGKRRDWFFGKSDSPTENCASGKDWFLGKRTTTISTPQTQIPPPPPKKRKGCPSCGASGLFFKADSVCANCGRIVCGKCVPVWHGNLVYKTKEIDGAGIYENTGFCSEECRKQFSDKVKNFSLTHIIGTNIDQFQRNLDEAWNQAIFSAISLHYKQKAYNAIMLHSINNPAFPAWDSHTKRFSQAYLDFGFIAKLALAGNLERCGRTLDSAKIYEELQKYDKARELRQQDRHILVKNTNVSIDLNSLLKQVQDGGIVAVYRCPFCGGKLKVNQSTTLDSLRKCEHCNSDIKAMDLADFLKAVL